MADFISKTVLSQQLVNRGEYRATHASGALAQSLNFEDSVEIEEVRLHLDSVATQEDFTISLNSGNGAIYDTNLLTVDMSEDADGNAGVVLDVVFRPVRSIPVTPKDVVDFAWANTDAVGWGLTVVVRQQKD
jgi:hypothetical protein